MLRKEPDEEVYSGCLQCGEALCAVCRNSYSLSASLCPISWCIRLADWEINWQLETMPWVMISAAALGVAARKSATKSLIVKSIVLPKLILF